MKTARLSRGIFWQEGLAVQKHTRISSRLTVRAIRGIIMYNRGKREGRLYLKGEGQMETVHMGDRIRRAREEAGLVQQALAKAVGVSQRAVSYVERQPWVKLSTLRRYAQALGRPLGYFVEMPEERREGESRPQVIESAFLVVCRDPDFSFGARADESLTQETKRDIIRLYERYRQVRLLPEDLA